MLVGKYKISGTNSTGKYPNRIRVEWAGMRLVDVKSDKSRPYQHICKYPFNNPVRVEFIRQLKEADVSEEDIEMLLTVQSNKKEEN